MLKSSAGDAANGPTDASLTTGDFDFSGGFFEGFFTSKKYPDDGCLFWPFFLLLDCIFCWEMCVFCYFRVHPMTSNSQFRVWVLGCFFGIGLRARRVPRNQVGGVFPLGICWMPGKRKERATFFNSLSQWTLKKKMNGLFSLRNMESLKVQKVSHWLSKLRQLDCWCFRGF